MDFRQSRKVLRVLRIFAVFWASEFSSVVHGNVGRCSQFDFRCNNSNICVKQQFWCDHKKDCPEGDDEAPDCSPKQLTWEDFQSDVQPCLNDVRKAKRLPVLEFGMVPDQHSIDPYQSEENQSYVYDDSEEMADCDLVGYPKSCECHEQGRRALYCKIDSKLPNLLDVRPDPTMIEFGSDKGALGCIGPIFGAGVYSYMKQLLTLKFEGIGLRCLTSNVFQNHNLAALDLSNNKLKTFRPGTFAGINVCTLFLSNNLIVDWRRDVFSEHATIRWLDLRHNQITLQRHGMLSNLKGTCMLELTGNKIERLSNQTFHGLTHLCNIELSQNRIEVIEAGAFADLQNVGTINLGFNRIAELPKDLFARTPNLRQLELAYNTNITHIPANLFRYFNCTKLDLRGIIIGNIDEAMFRSLPPTCNVLFEKLYYCFFAHHIRNCTPKVDGISSFDHLLVSPTLVTLVWICAVCTVISNLTVFLTRWYLDRALKCGIHDMVVRDARVMSLFIKHLSFSDMLMGIYMFCICYRNEIWKGEYHRHAIRWINSNECKVLGIIAMSAAEISMMILTFIAFDRFATIVCGMKKSRLPVCTVRIILTWIWIVGILLAIIPAFVWGDRVHNYYGNNGVCLPLYLQEPHLNGWIYSLIVMIGLNGFLITIIVIAYSGIFCSVRRWRNNVPIESEESELMWRFFILVFLNLCCWLPTFAFKILALTSYKVPDATYAWIVTFVFPLNSAMNPLVYSISSSEFRSRVSRITGCHSLYDYLLRHLHVIGRRLSSPWSTSTDTCPTDTLTLPCPEIQISEPPPSYNAALLARHPRPRRPRSVHFPVTEAFVDPPPLTYQSRCPGFQRGSPLPFELVPLRLGKPDQDFTL